MQMRTDRDEIPALFQSSPEQLYGILLYHFVDDDATERENNPQYHLTSRSSLHAATKTSRRLPGGELISGEWGTGDFESSTTAREWQRHVGMDTQV